MRHDYKRVPLESMIICDCVNLEKIPGGRFFPRDFVVTDCPSLTTIPDNLNVQGRVHLRNIKSLTSLGKGLEVGELVVEQCPSLRPAYLEPTRGGPILKA
mmetsp:Transcript_22427/g.42024  ORF Transcript_22427/g.42024 Transcript_22427/m.42024 type:complete len:100 (+) Transcript_22427:247-546(+)